MRRSPRAERGSAVAQFVLVTVLLVVLVLAIAQLGLAIHVRNTLVASAAEGARYAANADRDLEHGVARTRDLITDALSAHYARDVRAEYVQSGGLVLVRVEVDARIPLVGLAGPSRGLQVAAHAIEERP